MVGGVVWVEKGVRVSSKVFLQWIPLILCSKGHNMDNVSEVRQKITRYSRLIVKFVAAYRYLVMVLLLMLFTLRFDTVWNAYGNQKQFISNIYSNNSRFNRTLWHVPNTNLHVLKMKNGALSHMKYS